MTSVFRLQVAGQLLDTEFQPTVTATCKGGHMTIRVNLNQSFVGAVHARDHRTPQCMVSGNGSTHATLGINLFAANDSPEYCGVLVNNVSPPREIMVIRGNAIASERKLRALQKIASSANLADTSAAGECFPASTRLWRRSK